MQVKRQAGIRTNTWEVYQGTALLGRFWYGKMTEEDFLSQYGLADLQQAI